ncbi:MAG: hypothetical protein ABI614_06015 [Planctomycetota bacterium]
MATEISELVQQFASVNLQAEEQSGAEDEAENVRIIQQLNREEPHSIDEDSTFKRPHGFSLEGQAANGIRDVVRLLSAFEIPRTACNSSSARIATRNGELHEAAKR